MCRELETPEWDDDVKDALAAVNKAAAENSVTVMPMWVAEMYGSKSDS